MNLQKQHSLNSDYSEAQERRQSPPEPSVYTRVEPSGAKARQRFYKDRKPLWQKLELILDRIDKRGHSGLSRQELQELGGLYRCVAADLARARAHSKQNGHELQLYLNNLAVRAHNQIYQDEGSNWLQVAKFFWYGFPALTRKYAIYILTAFLIFLIPALVSYYAVQSNPDFAEMEILAGQPIVPPEVAAAVETHKLWTADKAKISPLASSFIITNNIRVTILAFALGITFAVGTVFVLMFNGLHIGSIFGVCHLHGMAHDLLTFIYGHGFLELSAIFICGGAGLLMGKALLFPGRYSRIDSLKMVSKDAFCLLAGCVPLLLIAGTIEGFISTQEAVPGTLKYMIGIISFVGLILYLMNGLNFKKS